MKCLKRIHLIENESDVKDTLDDPKENKMDEVEEIGPVEGLESLMNLKEASRLYLLRKGNGCEIVFFAQKAQSVDKHAQ